MDGKCEEPTTSQTDDENVNTRKGGQETEEKVVNKIIVDMREFRSELPSLLHQRGIEIEPLTIIVR